MARETTALHFRRALVALLIVAVVIAVLPHCAMPCCKVMPSKGMAPMASNCSAPCEDRNATIATGAQTSVADAVFASLAHARPIVVATGKLERAAIFWSLQDAQQAPTSASLPIYVRDRSLLI